MSERVLVTGGAGFIGSHLVQGLLEHEYRVRVVDNFSTGSRGNLEQVVKPAPHVDHLEIVEADIRDGERLSRLATDCDAIFHLAAIGSVPRSVEDPMTTQTVNADGTLNVFLAARDCGIKRVIYASSSAVYGDSKHMPRTEGHEGRVLSPYALTKVMNEEYGHLFHRLYGVETIGLRFFNIYGPRQDPNSQYAAVVPRFVSALLGGNKPVIYGSGHQSRDFTYVKDVVRANIAAWKAGVSVGGVCCNVGAGEQYSVLELLSTLQELLGTSVTPEFAPPRPGDVIASSADMTLTRELIGFTAQTVLRDGLRATLRWYQGEET